MNRIEKLVYMANQIARNFASLGPGAPAATAHHIASFWDPGMRAKIFARLDEPDSGLSAVAAQAVASLRAEKASANP